MNLLGLDVPKHLVPARENDNPLGFWEGQRVVDHNNTFLRAIGSHWYDFAPPDLELIPDKQKEDFIDGAIEIIDTEFANSPCFVLKDPRICLLFPLWKAALNRRQVDVLCVLQIRNPLEVANSLTNRNQILHHEGLLSWLRFVLASEASTRNETRVFTHFGDLLEDWRATSQRIAQTLGFDWSNLSDTTQQEISDFLSPKWRHHNATKVDLLEDFTVADWVKETYQVLRCWSQERPTSEGAAMLDEIRSDFDRSASAYRPLVEAARPLPKALQAADQKKLHFKDKLLIAHSSMHKLEQERGARIDAVTAERDRLKAELHTAQEATQHAIARAQENALAVAASCNSRIMNANTEHMRLQEELFSSKNREEMAQQALLDTSLECAERIEAVSNRLRSMNQKDLQEAVRAPKQNKWKSKAGLFTLLKNASMYRKLAQIFRKISAGKQVTK